MNVILTCFCYCLRYVHAGKSAIHFIYVGVNVHDDILNYMVLYTPSVRGIGSGNTDQYITHRKSER